MRALFLCCILAGCARGGSSPLVLAGYYGASLSVNGVAYKTIYSFKFDSTTSGSFLQGALTNVKGTLYGTTQGGGAHGLGTVFTLTPAGAQKILYSFKGGKDGANPMYGSLVEVKGVLYGTTSRGGSRNFGTVFKITTGGAEKVVHAFTAQSNGGIDGAMPEGAMTNVKGTLYGTTKNGGAASNDGTVTISPSGNEKVIHTFSGRDGQYPYGGLTYSAGALYGTTCSGGNASQGTVFKMTTSGHEAWLYSFKESDGACPGYGTLAVEGNALFGTTTKGGKGIGTVYKIATSHVAKVLHVFQAASGNDGAVPQSRPTFANGILYGTTSEGGGAGYDGTAYLLRPREPNGSLRYLNGSAVDAIGRSRVIEIIHRRRAVARSTP